MTIRRRILGSAIVLVALIVLYVVGSATSPAHRRSRIEKLLPDFSAAETLGISIESRDASIELTRSDARWDIVEGGTHYPARTDRIDVLLDELSAARVVRVVSRSESNFEQLGVGEGATTLTLDLRGVSLPAIVWGATASEPSLSYVRRTGETAVYATDARIGFYLSQSAIYWSYLRMFPESISPTDVISLSIQGTIADSRGESRRVSIDLQRRAGSDSQWYQVPGETPLAGDAVDGLLRNVVDLVGADFAVGVSNASNNVGEGASSVTVTFDTSAGRRFTVAISERGDSYIAIPAGPDLPGDAYGGLAYLVDRGTVARVTPDLSSLVVR